jgi:hypothetical protein
VKKVSTGFSPLMIRSIDSGTVSVGSGVGETVGICGGIGVCVGDARVGADNVAVGVTGATVDAGVEISVVAVGVACCAAAGATMSTNKTTDIPESQRRTPRIDTSYCCKKSPLVFVPYG